MSPRLVDALVIYGGAAVDLGVVAWAVLTARRAAKTGTARQWPRAGIWTPPGALQRLGEYATGSPVVDLKRVEQAGEATSAFSERTGAAGEPASEASNG